MGRPKASKDAQKRKRKSFWTPAEIKLLKEKYYNHTNTELSKLLNKSVGTIINRANKLHLAKLHFLITTTIDKIEELNYGGVYAIVNKNDGMLYVGSANNIAKRLYQHMSKLNNNRHENKNLQCEWNQNKEYFYIGLLWKDSLQYQNFEQKFIRGLPQHLLYNSAAATHKITVPYGIKKVLYTKINKGGGCWLWSGKIDSDGYGIIRYDNKEYMVHRLVYSIENNFNLDGFVIRHQCNNRHCCNPAHLLHGTTKDNNDDYNKSYNGEKSSLYQHKEEIINKYTVKKQTIQSLADEYGVHHPTMWTFIKRFCKIRNSRNRLHATN